MNPSSHYACRGAYVPSDLSLNEGDPVSTVGIVGPVVTASGSACPTFRAARLNGRGVAEFDGEDDVLTAASANDWRFLHDGHSLTLVALVRQRDANPNRYDALVDTCVGASANIGLSWGLDDRASVPRNNAVFGLIGRGVSGQPLWTSVTQEVTRPGSWQLHVLRYAYGSRAQMTTAADGFLSVDGLAVGRADVRLASPSTATATHPLRIGAIHLSLYAKIDLAGLWLFDVALDDDELASVLDWVEDRYGVSRARVVTDTPAYLMGPAIVPDGTGYRVFASLSYRHDPQGGTSGRLVEYRSSDGQTWESPRLVAAGTGLDVRSGTAYRTSAGTWLVAGFTDDGGATGQSACVFRSTDGESWSEAIRPAHGFTKWSASGGTILQLSNGDLLWTVYGQHTGDSWTSAKTVRSTDDGATWLDPVIIANGQALSKHLNEACLVALSATDLLSMVRNDTNNRLDRLHSTDAGATWTTPVSALTEMGGMPTLVRDATSGTIYCVGRSRSGNLRGMVAWSADGTTWPTPTYTLDAVNGFSNYSSIVALGNDRLMIVTASEHAAQSAQPTSSSLRVRVHRCLEIRGV